ncbi:uncharacterized protein FTJAE_13860 [Fusarium tjaetaba]|uniref:DUF6546 domain-containing protein n=1 Tax=Fusarium tjaetaba TaxID=1567544 RepID=A0A8H5QE11_9HYPO|nr:uncharacterized protein FTJAE_13860 [Fusarium tjaetaba]KAF5613650.1 hypothetical protein FTJAE_13860 [Fusarium tjaetaba]
MASWNSLPPEIRRMVFQASLSQSPNPTAPDPTAPVLATVSREWQDFFERSTFKDLAVIYVTKNNRIFTQAMAVLLKVLSLWSGDYGGLELELDARSPSDCRYFNLIYELHDDFLFRHQNEDELFDTVERFYRKRHEIVKRSLGILPGFTRRSMNLAWKVNYSSTRRLRGEHLKLKPSLIKRGWAYSQIVRNLPATPIVKGLVIRRVAPRLIALESLGKIMRESFMALEYFSYSTYMERTDHKEQDFLDDLATQLLPSLPASLKTFRYSRRPVRDTCHPWINKLPKSLLFAQACHRFTEFRAPHDIPPLILFDDIVAGGERKESKLENLSIVTMYLAHFEPQCMITKHLISAAQAAAMMPRLRTMELSCSYQGYGCLFRCEMDDYKVQITWRYLQNGPSFDLEEQVIQEWEKIASHRLFNVNNAPFDKNEGQWKRPMIIPYLHLKRLAYSTLEEAQLRAFQDGYRQWWYKPMTQESRGIY